MHMIHAGQGFVKIQVQTCTRNHMGKKAAAVGYGHRRWKTYVLEAGSNAGTTPNCCSMPSWS